MYLYKHFSLSKHASSPLFLHASYSLYEALVLTDTINTVIAITYPYVMMFTKTEKFYKFSLL